MCSSLTSITIPRSVTTLGYSALQECTCLTSIIIPSNIRHIEYNAFGGCTNLASVTFETTTGWSVFDFNSIESTLSSSDLANTSTAATYLTTTYTNCMWSRS